MYCPVIARSSHSVILPTSFQIQMIKMPAKLKPTEIVIVNVKGPMNCYPKSRQQVGVWSRWKEQTGHRCRHDIIVVTTVTRGHSLLTTCMVSSFSPIKIDLITEYGIHKNKTCGCSYTYFTIKKSSKFFSLLILMSKLGIQVESFFHYILLFSFALCVWPWMCN